MKQKKGSIDFYLFVCILILLAIGINMVFSASMYEDKQLYGNSYRSLIKQLIWSGLGLITMFIMMGVDYRKLRNRKLISFGMIITLILLVVVLFMPDINGARRWIGVGGLGIQPSEIAKIILILYLSDSIIRKKENIKSFGKGILPALLVSAVFAGLVIKEPNMSTAVIIMSVTICLLFAGGAKFTQIASIFAVGIGAAVFAIKFEPYRMRRFTAFLDPWKDPLATGYQAIQSLYALGSGGLTGVGFGMSHQKLFYIPEAHTDFIFSIIGEEIGLIGVFIIILLFAFIIWRGMKIALKCPDKFGSLVATGITSLIAIQSSINFLVVSSFMPITGVTLPLISYGGSSLLFTMAMLGILLNISRNTIKN